MHSRLPHHRPGRRRPGPLRLLRDRGVHPRIVGGSYRVPGPGEVTFGVGPRQPRDPAGIGQGLHGGADRRRHQDDVSFGVEQTADPSGRDGPTTDDYDAASGKAQPHRIEAHRRSAGCGCGRCGWPTRCSCPGQGARYTRQSQFILA